MYVCHIHVSMATPIVAAAALLVKQYFEEQSTHSSADAAGAHRWSSICRQEYRACPVVNTEVDYVSGPLVKAVLVRFYAIVGLLSVASCLYSIAYCSMRCAILSLVIT